MPCGYIYKIVFPNGKHYIGLTTTSLEQRTKEHKYCAKNGDTKCLYNALRKYGMVDTFELIEIDTADTLEELCKKEIGYIIEYNSYYMNENGYNMTYGGEGTFGYIHREENNQKNSERMKKYFEDPEARKEQSNRIKKYFEDNPEAGKEHGEIMKKYYEDKPEARQQMSEIKKQYHNDNPEARKEQGKKLKTHYENPEARKKNSEAVKKYYEDNPEAKEQISEKSTKQWENPEARKQMSKIKQKYYEDNPEAIQKNREALKKYYEDNSEARQKLSDGKGKNKPFDVFTKDGTFIKTFTYQFEAKEYLEKEYDIFIFLSNISAVLSGKRNNTIGFVFKYK
jgi:hypothetical protein